MNVALLFQMLSAFANQYSEVEKLITRIWEEYDKNKTDGMTSGLSVQKDKIDLDKEFLAELRVNHLAGLEAFETQYSLVGEPVTHSMMLGTGSLFGWLPFLIEHREVISAILSLISQYQNGDWTIQDVLDLIISFKEVNTDSLPEN